MQILTFRLSHFSAKDDSRNMLESIVYDLSEAIQSDSRVLSHPDLAHCANTLLLIDCGRMRPVFIDFLIKVKDASGEMA